MGHAKLDDFEKFNTKVLNFEGFGFLEKSNITESIRQMLFLKSIFEQIFDLRAKVLIFKDFRILENIADIGRKHMSL